MSNKLTILWLRQDLRLNDNSALQAAIEAGGPILPVYIDDREAMGDWAPTGASLWFLHRALESLEASFKKSGGQLFYLKGDSLAELKALIDSSGAGRVYWNRRYEGPHRERDAAIKKALRDAGIEVKSCNTSLLNEPHTVSTGSGQPYKVYTPYWRNVKERKLEPPVEVDLKTADFYTNKSMGCQLEDLKLLPDHPWHRKLEAYWDVSEESAMKYLDKFLAEPVAAYDTDRDLPRVAGTSRLSPYLHWGLIGPRQVMERLHATHDLREQGPQTYAKEIYWREFAYNVLYHFPHTPDAPLQEKYADFPWEYDKSVLKQWQQGRTGYPIVDAGMRELYETGWMHNRVRMIVSSLLVKHLLQDWRDGARWFWDTLVDADLASNTLGWQWSGGCGADAAPYFRIFNPMTQGKKFDPDGDYVKHWVPELKHIPTKFIHEPWEAPPSVLEQAGCQLGEDYPEPIIDHKKGRERALAAFDKVKAS
ncbi:deoxyribodipyrimidine photolyase [Coraliomargarita sinensis]|uniref:Deoxyribodipyrimidine photo-lyase n=1 Tax=Coraliomargarita sinensis TaxID=2174842 RepID=A0A317ZHK8_9BACT|nr:deoxyribodipyrimidine photo-lyase [Coraliomargarita sinensis]PXA05194.1 deoxyribodipyrimidine photolyase [Coraliomargarita sinensis]